MICTVAPAASAPARKQASTLARSSSSRAALGLSPNQDAEIARNAALWTAPTMPALHRYTGVLYDALDVRSLRGAAAARAGDLAGPEGP